MKAFLAEHGYESEVAGDAERRCSSCRPCIPTWSSAMFAFPE